MTPAADQRMAVGYKRAMTNARRFQLDELTHPPGHLLQPPDRGHDRRRRLPEVDHELFDIDDFEAADWVLISEDTPLDEHHRDELVERFQLTYQPGGELVVDDDDDDEDDDREDEDLELDEVDLDGA